MFVNVPACSWSLRSLSGREGAYCGAMEGAHIPRGNGIWDYPWPQCLELCALHSSWAWFWWAGWSGSTAVDGSLFPHVTCNFYADSSDVHADGIACSSSFSCSVLVDVQTVATSDMCMCVHFHTFQRETSQASCARGDVLVQICSYTKLKSSLHKLKIPLT